MNEQEQQQARATEEDWDSLYGFLQTLEDMVETNDKPEDIGAYVYDYINTTDGVWKRVLFRS